MRIQAFLFKIQTFSKVKMGSSKTQNSICHCAENNRVARSRKHRGKERNFFGEHKFKIHLFGSLKMKSFNLFWFELSIVNVEMWTIFQECWQSNHREHSQFWPSFRLVSLITLLPKRVKLLKNATNFKGFGRCWARFLREKTYIFEILIKNCFT